MFLQSIIMKTCPIVALLCVSILFAGASAQELTPEQREQREIEQSLRYLSSPKKWLSEEADELSTFRAPWNGQGSWLPLRVVMRAGAEAELGLTDEQKQRLSYLYKENEIGQEWFQKMFQNPTPEFTQAVKAVAATEIPGDPLFERATEEQKDAYREASAAMTGLWMESMQTELQETLTPKQMLQVRKLEMQLMPAMGIPFPSMFDPLDLTDGQKKAMSKIADELKVEFDRLTLEAASLKAERLAITHGTLQGKSFTSRDEFHKAISEAHRQFVPSEAMRKKSNDLGEQGTKLMTLLQTRFMNVLTDEQLDKMQKILDEAPAFAKNMIAVFKMRQAAARLSPTYIPGPDAWRPGDPMPGRIIEERQRGRFPRGEN